MVERAYVRGAVVGGELVHNILIKRAPTSSARSDVFSDRSKSRGGGSNCEIISYQPEKLLATGVGWIQPQSFQSFHTGAQQESHPVHHEKIHATKPDSPIQVNPVIQKIHPPEIDIVSHPHSGGMVGGTSVTSSADSSLTRTKL